jgi:chorismate-pyruvate lyase
MLDLSSFPLSLQVLMHTDGTVTDLIELLAHEKLTVIKLHENTNEGSSLLTRKIYLQGKKSKINWLCAESKIYLHNLNDNFVKDLIHHSIPIGTLWTKYKIETYKNITEKKEELSIDIEQTGYKPGKKLLLRTYEVFNNQKLIMEITERFPISHFDKLAL